MAVVLCKGWPCLWYGSFLLPGACYWKKMANAVSTLSLVLHWRPNSWLWPTARTRNSATNRVHRSFAPGRCPGSTLRSRFPLFQTPSQLSALYYLSLLRLVCFFLLFFLSGTYGFSVVRGFRRLLSHGLVPDDKLVFKLSADGREIGTSIPLILIPMVRPWSGHKRRWTVGARGCAIKVWAVLPWHLPFSEALPLSALDAVFNFFSRFFSYSSCHSFGDSW